MREQVRSETTTKMQREFKAQMDMVTGRVAERDAQIKQLRAQSVELNSKMSERQEELKRLSSVHSKENQDQ